MFIRGLTAHETAYSTKKSFFLDVIRLLQREDAFAKAKVVAIESIRSRRRSAGTTSDPWTLDETGVLRYNGLLYVPEDGAIRAELLHRYHDDPMAGHFAVEKTYDLLGRKYFWKGMKRDVKEYVEECDLCQRVKVHRHRPYGELQSLPLPDRPWKEITLDFITDLPPSRCRLGVYDSVLVVVDRYTKIARYFPTTKSIKAVDLAELFIDKIITQYGCPKGIVSDRGPVFTSGFWSEVCFHLKIKRRLSTAFHPQTDGQTERQNQVLEHYLRCYCSEQQNNWAKLLPMAEYVHNNSLNSTLNMSPFFALYGYHPELEYDVGDDDHQEGVPAAEERIVQLLTARESMENRWKTAVESQKKYYDKKHKPQQFKVGDLVLLSTKNLKQRRPKRKLSHRYIGPFRVQDLVGKQAYRLHLPTNYRIHNVFHVSYLEPYSRRRNDVSTPKMPPPELIDDEEVYEVEAILQTQRHKGRRYYLVKWTGWDDDYNQWVPEENMGGAKELREEFDSRTTRKRKRATGT